MIMMAMMMAVVMTGRGKEDNNVNFCILNGRYFDIILQTSADEAEGRVKELITAVEELQKLLKQATEAQAELEDKVQKMEREHEHAQQELSKQLFDLNLISLLLCKQ